MLLHLIEIRKDIHKHLQQLRPTPQAATSTVASASGHPGPAQQQAATADNALVSLPLAADGADTEWRMSMAVYPTDDPYQSDEEVTMPGPILQDSTPHTHQEQQGHGRCNRGHNSRAQHPTANSSPSTLRYNWTTTG